MERLARQQVQLTSYDCPKAEMGFGPDGEPAFPWRMTPDMNLSRTARDRLASGPDKGFILAVTYPAR